MDTKRTHARESVHTDAHGRVKAGDVLVLRSQVHTPWSHCLVLGFSEPDKHGDVYILLARPFACVSMPGVQSPGALLGHETVETTIGKLDAWLHFPGNYVR